MQIELSKDLIENQSELNNLELNWHYVKLCFEVWNLEINAKRQRKSIEEIKSSRKRIKLEDIAGTGRNYINEICAGRVAETKRTFNAQMDEILIRYLKGHDGFVFYDEPKLKRYIVLKRANNLLLASKKKKDIKTGTIVDNWIKNNRDNKYATIEQEIENLKLDLKKDIKEKGAYEGTDGLTVTSRLLRYLKGEETEEVSLSEREVYIYNLAMVVRELNYRRIEAFSDSELDNLYFYAKLIFERVDAIKKYREMKMANNAYEIRVQENIEKLLKKD